MTAIRELSVIPLAAVALLGAVALAAPPATALDDIAIGGAASQQAGACPALTEIKYPWATCTPNAFGGVALGAPGQPAPPECSLRMSTGECAAAPTVWGSRSTLTEVIVPAL